MTTWSDHDSRSGPEKGRAGTGTPDPASGPGVPPETPVPVPSPRSQRAGTGSGSPPAARAQAKPRATNSPPEGTGYQGEAWRKRVREVQVAQGRQRRGSPGRHRAARGTLPSAPGMIRRPPPDEEA